MQQRVLVVMAYCIVKVSGLAIMAVALHLGSAAPTVAESTFLPDFPASPLARSVVPKATAKPKAQPIVLRKGGGFYSADMMYQVRGAVYASDADEFYSAEGLASWYGPGFHGKRTANGEVYDMHALTAAHKTLPLPSIARVTNLDNGQTVLVRINDRGPFSGDRIIDLSHASALALGTATSGVGRVQVEYVGVAPLNGNDSRERAFLSAQQQAEPTGPAPSSAVTIQPVLPAIRTGMMQVSVGTLTSPLFPTIQRANVRGQSRAARPAPRRSHTRAEAAPQWRMPDPVRP